MSNQISKSIYLSAKNNILLIKIFQTLTVAPVD
jgi:hypothetical protein